VAGTVGVDVADSEVVGQQSLDELTRRRVRLSACQQTRRVAGSTLFCNSGVARIWREGGTTRHRNNVSHTRKITQNRGQIYTVLRKNRMHSFYLTRQIAFIYFSSSEVWWKKINRWKSRGHVSQCPIAGDTNGQQILPTVTFLFFFRTDSTDSPRTVYRYF